MHGQEQGGPQFLQGEQVRITGEGFREARITNGSRAARDGQGASAADWVEVLALGKGQDHLMPEGSGNGVVKDSGTTRILARFMELGALLGLEARRGIERQIDDRVQDRG